MNEIGTNEIITNRLHLRRFKKDDSDKLYECLGFDDKLTRYISWFPYDSKKSCEKFVEENLRQYKDNPLFLSWIILLDEEIIGTISIFNVDRSNDSGELGYLIASKYQNKGYVTEASKSVIEYAFKKIGIHRIYASCHEDNAASKHVLNKLSFTYEGKLRDGQKNMDDTFSNLDLYSILINDYQ